MILPARSSCLVWRDVRNEPEISTVQPYGVIPTRSLSIRAGNHLYDAIAVETETDVLLYDPASNSYVRSGARAHLVLAEQDILTEAVLETLPPQTVPVRVNDTFARFITFDEENLPFRGLANMIHGSLTGEIFLSRVMVGLNHIVEADILQIHLPNGMLICIEVMPDVLASLPWRLLEKSETDQDRIVRKISGKADADVDAAPAVLMKILRRVESTHSVTHSPSAFMDQNFIYLPSSLS